MTAPAIEAVGLRKVFPAQGGGPGRRPSGPVTAVDGIDLAVPAGQFLALLGPNGAGKSTTIGMLTTRVRPSDGVARVGGIDVVKNQARAKRLFGVVPQQNTLDRSLTVRENLEFHARFYGFSRQAAQAKADGVLERFALADKSDATTFALSGGMAQRLLVARALMHDPEVLFLDEPTTGIDPQNKLVLWDLLRELHVAGQTILLTTHAMDEADTLCERVVVIDQGKILADGTPAELKASLGAGTVIVLTVEGDGAALGARAKDLPDVLGVDVDRRTVRVRASQASGLLASLVMAAADVGTPVVDASVTPPTLEQVFLALTGRELRS